MVSACQQLACRREAGSRSTHQELTCICKPHTQCVSTRAFILLPRLSEQPISYGLLDYRRQAGGGCPRQLQYTPKYRIFGNSFEKEQRQAPQQHVLPMTSQCCADKHLPATRNSTAVLMSLLLALSEAARLSGWRKCRHKLLACTPANSTQPPQQAHRTPLSLVLNLMCESKTV